jgi:Ca2+-binding RTX toxin-like protein
MAYNATGTAGNDTLNQGGDSGPGTIVGLAGDDCIFTGSGVATVTGDSGNDSVFLQTANTGTINGGTENDWISDLGTAIGSMQLFGGDGADTVLVTFATTAQTVTGGNDSSDGNDFILTGSGADLIFGNGGNDTLHSGSGSDTVVAGFGNDSVFQSGGGSSGLFFGNQGNDSFNVYSGNDTTYGGLGNDSVIDSGTGRPMYFGNEGADTVDASGNTGGGLTVIGGQDSADGNDSILTGSGADWIFGNGGNDTINTGAGANTAIGGQGSDLITAGAVNDLVFANEANDTVIAGDGANTVFGGQGNDSILAGTGRDTLQGNEGNDTIRGGLAIDTISGGTGNDWFAYSLATEDGENAAGGGPVEFITDVDFSTDKFQTTTAITFATNIGAGTGGDLNASANNAITAATALNGGINTVAAQFTFGGRTYLAINVANAGFLDADDLLLDITGATGTIATGNFTI